MEVQKTLITILTLGTLLISQELQALACVNTIDNPCMVTITNNTSHDLILESFNALGNAASNLRNLIKANDDGNWSAFPNNPTRCDRDGNQAVEVIYKIDGVNANCHLLINMPCTSSDYNLVLDQSKSYCSNDYTISVNNDELVFTINPPLQQQQAPDNNKTP